MSDITTARQGRILEITLNRPKVNAIDAATSRAMGEAFRTLQEDDGLSVGIITAAGERFFSAGWDLKAAAAGEDPYADQGVGGFAGLTEYWGLSKPVIAAVNGTALGGGFELALAADMIVAARHAEFALTEAAIGLVADSGGVVRLPRRLPRALAMEMMMTGRRASAEELHRWGLVNAVVEASELLPTARDLAARVAACAPLSLQAIKEIDRATQGTSEEEAFAIMRAAAGNDKLPVYQRVYASEDAAEGMAAVAQKAHANLERQMMLTTETFLHDWTGEIATPLTLVHNRVKPEWVDEYQHLNMAHYLTICDQANWAFWNWLNAPAQTIDARGGREYSIVENHIIYLGELAEGAEFSISTQLCAFDDKRYILFHRVLNVAGEVAATNEVKCLGFDLHARRACTWREEVYTRLAQVHAAHAALPTPPQAGQGIVLKKR